MVSGRVLVTGATGGLGRVLVPALRGIGAKVVATGRRDAPPGWGEGEVAFRRADLAHDPIEPLTREVDTVFHLAALSAPWGPRAAFFSANVIATQRLLEAAQAARCRLFVHVSTPSIYAEARDRIGLNERSAMPARAPNEYARTKFEAESAVLAGGGRMATVVLRPRAIVSPFDTVLLPRLLRAARRGTLVLPNGGRALVELTDARDVVSALLAAYARGADLSGSVFNISGGAPLSIRQVAALVFRQLGREVRIRSLPGRLVLALGSVAEHVAAALPGRPEPPLTRYGAMVTGWSQTFDLQAARTTLGWHPRYTPEEAIAWALSGLRHA